MCRLNELVKLLGIVDADLRCSVVGCVLARRDGRRECAHDPEKERPPTDGGPKSKGGMPYYGRQVTGKFRTTVCHGALNASVDRDASKSGVPTHRLFILWPAPGGPRPSSCRSSYGQEPQPRS
jgi:hypothetical protein